MKIKYLGTAAAEGIPALFCDCDTCRKARKSKGKNVRSRSQMLINDDLLIDYPPDSFYHFLINGIDLQKIKNLVISHVHEDHFYPLDFEYFLKGYSFPRGCLPFTIYGSEDLEPSLKPYLDNERNQGLRYMKMKPYMTYPVGRYTVTPLEASHGTSHPFIHLVADGEKEILYCHDSGPLKEEVFEYLSKAKRHIDMVSIDCTAGDRQVDWKHHMNVEMAHETIERLKAVGCVDAATRVILNHFSHNGGHVLYEEMSEIANKYGYEVSYDGMEIEL